MSKAEKRTCLNRQLKETGDKSGRYTRSVKLSSLKKVRIVLSKHSRLQCKVRTDRTGVDNPGSSNRLKVVYNRRSRKYGFRRLVSVERSDLDERPSIVGRYKGANWMERERWEMYGVGIVGHPDRRRLLSDYGKEGNPLRKDYPLSGYKEVEYSESRKRVVEQPR